MFNTMIVIFALFSLTDVSRPSPIFERVGLRQDYYLTSIRSSKQQGVMKEMDKVDEELCEDILERIRLKEGKSLNRLRKLLLKKKYC